MISQGYTPEPEEKFQTLKPRKTNNFNKPLLKKESMFPKSPPTMNSSSMNVVNEAAGSKMKPEDDFRMAFDSRISQVA